MNFLMVCKLIGFELVVFKLLMFKICGIIGISKIEFLNFFGTENVNYDFEEKDVLSFKNLTAFQKFYYG